MHQCYLIQALCQLPACYLVHKRLHFKWSKQSHPYLKLLEKSECVVLPLLVMTVPACPLLSVIREQLRSHYSLTYHGDNSDEQPHSFYHLPCYGRDSTWKGNGPSPLPVYENPEPLAGPWATPEVTLVEVNFSYLCT